MFEMNCYELDEFKLSEVLMFQTIECGFVRFFQRNFNNNTNINHCREEDKILILNLVRNVMGKYDTTDMYMCDICAAILFAFYALVLLEIMGDQLSLEEVCRCMKYQKDAIEKIQQIYYGIVLGDDPVLSEVRGRILMPGRYITMHTM
jgi:hypothetical protein